MVILGLNFGHDASVCVIQDGRVLVNICRERFSRVKHAMSLRAQHVDLALDDAGLSIEDIDYCAVTTSQGYPATFFKEEGMTVRYSLETDGSIPLSSAIRRQWREFSEAFSATTEHVTSRFSRYLQEHDSTSRLFTDPVEDIAYCLPTTETYITRSEWRQSLRLDQIPAQLSPAFFAAAGSEDIRHGMHFPAKFSFRGVQVPTIVCSHHAAHAASSFYMSDKETAAILTVDGSTPQALGSYKGGMFYFGRGNHIIPIWPHGLCLGNLYSMGSEQLGFGAGGEGKFMGLTPYGRSAFMDHRYIGCIKTVLDNWNVTDDYFASKNLPVERWVEHCRKRASTAGYDLSGYGQGSRITEPINADFAASTQKVFEETLLLAVRQLADCCNRIGITTRELCLAGGTMLNCPANSRIANESAFDDVYIVPGCDDSGLAIGAALFLAHNILDAPRAPQNPKTTRAAYLGRVTPNAELTKVAKSAQGEFIVSEPDDPALDAGSALADDKVVAWYEGRSEFGPRALGHRSLLADPRKSYNWQRVNQIKGREQWRPFAPAVLEEKLAEWFSQCPSPSPLMLFTGQVRRPDLPAITHLDGSSRVQSVAHDCGGYRRLIETFDQITNCPVVLNTSLNGPAEPIVESPEEALSFLRSSGVDVLYMDGVKVITRRHAAGV